MWNVVFVPMWRTYPWSLSKHFVCTVYTFTFSRRSSREETQWSEVILVFNVGRCLGCIISRCTNPGRQVARAKKSLYGDSSICVFSVCILPRHPSGGRNFEVALTFLKRLCAHVLRNKNKFMCLKRYLNSEWHNCLVLPNTSFIYLLIYWTLWTVQFTITMLKLNISVLKKWLEMLTGWESGITYIKSVEWW